MKKWTILFAVLAMAFVSQADIVDGDFAAGTLGANTQTYFAYLDSQIDAGWINYSGTSPFSAAANNLTRDLSAVGNGGRSVGQIFNHNLAAGNYNFNFDYNWTSTDTTGDLWVQLYLYDNITGTDSLAYNTRLDMTGATQFTTPASTAAFNISEVATSGNLIAATTGGSFAPVSIAFTLASSMGSGDLMAIRIGSLNSGGQTTATQSFDNFEIVAVPEPATVGMLSLGALVALFARRARSLKVVD